MSTTEQSAVTEAGERPTAQRHKNTGAATAGPGRWMAGGAPPEKALDFKGSLKRAAAAAAPRSGCSWSGCSCWARRASR